MKKAIRYHLDSFITTISFFKAGKLLQYFLPGIFISLIFLTINYTTHVVFGDIQPESKWFASAWYKVGTIIDFILTQIYIFTILTLLSPVNTLLSERVDTLLTGETYRFNIIRIINDLVRMIFVVIIAMLLQLAFITLWWLICKIIGLSNTFVYEGVSFCISAFFFGFSFYDYSLERYNINVAKSIQFSFSHPLLILLTGIVFKLLYYFPYFWKVSYLGIIIAPVVTTIISTVIYIRLDDSSSKKRDMQTKF